MRPICLDFRLQRKPQLPPQGRGEGSDPAAAPHRPPMQEIPNSLAAQWVCAHVQEEHSNVATSAGL